MNLNPNQISAILDGLRHFDDDGEDYWSYDGTHHLTEQEVDELIQMLEAELERLK